MSALSEQYLSAVPTLVSLLPAILTKANKVYNPAQALPTTRFWVVNISLDKDKLKAFNRLCVWQHDDLVHPGFLHTLSFSLQLKLMLLKDFPFTILGAVHIANEFEQFLPIKPTSTVDVSCQFGAITPIKIGCLFTIKTEFFVAQRRVMSASHQYLRRDDTQPQTKVATIKTPSWQDNGEDESWSLAKNLGWQYAKCSQDYNPIHLHPWSAKILGFKQHIAHGMWMKSRAFSALCASLPVNLSTPLSCAVEFKKPLFLPNSAVFQGRTSQVKANTQFRIISQVQQQTIEHMTGRLIYLDN